MKTMAERIIRSIREDEVFRARGWTVPEHYVGTCQLAEELGGRIIANANWGEEGEEPQYISHYPSVAYQFPDGSILWVHYSYAEAFEDSSAQENIAVAG